MSRITWFALPILVVLATIPAFAEVPNIDPDCQEGVFRWEGKGAVNVATGTFCPFEGPQDASLEEKGWNLEVNASVQTAYVFEVGFKVPADGGISQGSITAAHRNGISFKVFGSQWLADTHNYKHMEKCRADTVQMPILYAYKLVRRRRFVHITYCAWKRRK